MLKQPTDVLFLIDARIDSGRAKGSPQLNKDIRVLKKARAEIERLRDDLSIARAEQSVLLRDGLARARQWERLAREMGELLSLIPNFGAAECQCADSLLTRLDRMPA